MAYSRWSNSRWYTIYLASGEKEKNNQIFYIFNVVSFTYEQLVGGMDKCLKEVFQNCDKVPDQKELDELRGYMCEFLKEVDEEFSL